MGSRLAPLILPLLALPALAAPPARCEGEVAEDRLRRVEEHGDLSTASGRLLKLADIRLADGARPRLTALEGEAIAIQIAGTGDRWGRVPARVVLARDGTDLAASLLADGLAFVDVGDMDALCRPGLLAAEAAPRGVRRGEWNAVLLRADDPKAIAGRSGSFAVIEGRVVSVGERARWTYLNFGRDFRHDFSVSISRRNWDAMQRAGLSADALKGRRIRVRGIVELRRAPGIEITSADMIEWRHDGRGSPEGR